LISKLALLHQAEDFLEDTLDNQFLAEIFISIEGFAVSGHESIGELLLAGSRVESNEVFDQLVETEIWQLG
jgi:hypothetical protein